MDNGMTWAEFAVAWNQAGQRFGEVFTPADLMGVLAFFVIVFVGAIVLGIAAGIIGWLLDAYEALK